MESGVTVTDLSSASEQARPETRRSLALRPDPTPTAPDHLPPSQLGVPTEPRALHRRPRRQRLGSHQAIRGDGPGHSHRDLPYRRLTPTAGGAFVRELSPVTELWGGGEEGEVPVPTGKRLRGVDQAADHGLPGRDKTGRSGRQPVRLDRLPFSTSP